MKTTGHGIEDSKDVENVYHLRLMALLQELVRERGYKGAAWVLEIDHRTVAETARTGQLSQRVRSALERALQEGAGSAAARQRERNDRLEQRVEALEGDVEEQGKEMRAGLRAAEDAVSGMRNETARALRRLDGVTAQAQTTGAAQGTAPPGAAQSRGKTTLRREFPDLVTREAADDDAEVFGNAWPLIVEWRELKDTHPVRGRGLPWLVTHERLLTIELALLEEHGMTLPPETYPLRGLNRRGQTSWRRTALYDTRQARARGEHLRWVRRICSLGLWRR